MRKLIAATIILGTGLFFQQPDIARAEYLNTMTIPAAKQAFFYHKIVDIEIANDDSLFVVYKSRVQHFSPAGPLEPYLQQCTIDMYPSEAAMDSLGNLFVSQCAMHKINRISSNGVLIPPLIGANTYVTCPNTLQNFLNPENIAISNSDKIYIPQPCSVVMIFNTNGEFLSQWDYKWAISDAKQNQMIDIAVNSQDDVYILDKIPQIKTGPYSYSYNKYIINKFTQNGEHLGIYWLLPQSSAIDTIGNISIDKNDNIYTITKTCSVDKYNANGEHLNAWNLNTPFPDCVKIKIDESNNFYVFSASHYYNNFIQKYDSNGGLLEEWSSEGSRDGEFTQANDVFVNTEGMIYVADTGNNRIQVFSPDGALLSKFGTQGSAAGKLNYLSQITVDQVGNIFVIDNYSRVQKFAANGAFITAITPKHADGTLFIPKDIAVNSQGNILIVSDEKGIIRQLSPDLQTTIADWQSHVTGTGTFRSKGITIDPSGNIMAFWAFNTSAFGTQYVVETFSPTGEYLSTEPINFNISDALSKYLEKFAVDSQGGIHAIANADPYSNKRKTYLVHIDSDREPVDIWKDDSGNSRNPGYYPIPQGIFIDSSDNIYVVDTSRILKYSYQEENAPPVAMPDNYTLQEDSPLSIAAPGVLSNDTDPDEDQLSARLVIGPLHGQLALNADGSFTYSPLANFNGTDTFTYEVSDPKGATSTPVATLNVLPVNDAPVVTINPAAPINEGSNLFLSGTFTDPDTDTWTVTVNYGDGSPEEQLIPDPSHASSMNHVYKDDGMYQVAITVLDSQGGIGSATTAVSVQNVAPVPSIDMIADGASVILADISINLLGSFIDPGVLDTHSVTINWGDGTNQTINPAVSPLNATHIYASPQTNSVDYTLMLTVQDNGGAVDVQSRTVTVVKPAGAVQDINNGLTDLLQSGTLTPAAAVDIADALTLLNGQTNANGTTSQSGAIAKFDTGQINAAMVKLIDAIQKLLDSQAADPSLNLESQLVMLTLTAKAAAVDAVNAAASNGTPINKIDEANALIAVGNTKLELDDYIGAALSYKAAVQKVQ